MRPPRRSCRCTAVRAAGGSPRAAAAAVGSGGFEDAEGLFAAVCERGLEGVVAKRERDPYRPGERGWVKTKNRATARFAEEREGVGRAVRSLTR